MFTPTLLANKTYTLCGYTFQIYNITGFDFTEEIKFPHTNGLYCFTAPRDIILKSSVYKQVHTLLYLGKAQYFDERFYNHHTKSALNGSPNLYLAIYCCNEQEDEEVLEKKVLSEYSFIHNENDNQKAKDLGKPGFITED